MNRNFPYSTSLTVGRRTVVLIEQAMDADERRLDLYIDRLHRGEVSFQPWYYPRLTIAGEDLLIWSGLRAYFIDLSGGEKLPFDFEDELHNAYSISDVWCLIFETSIKLWVPREDRVLSAVLHDEVLLFSWWVSEKLLVEDLQQRQFEVRIEQGPARVSLAPLDLD